MHEAETIKQPVRRKQDIIETEKIRRLTLKTEAWRDLREKSYEVVV